MPRMPAVAQESRSIREYTLAGGQTFITGAAVLLNAGVVQECGVDPASILGFALHPAGTMPHTTRVLVAIADKDSTYWLEGNVAPVAADVGAIYGITRDADLVWHVDKTKVGANARVRVVSIDTTRNAYEVKVLAANIQLS
jgi:hypothetical protein